MIYIVPGFVYCNNYPNHPSDIWQNDATNDQYQW